MKSLNKIALLSNVVLLALSACSFERRVYCVETSDGLEIAQGKCYQASKQDVVDTIFIINPQDENGNYDLVWNDSINTANYSFTDGLKGKKVIDLLKISDNTIKINIDGRVENQDATFGYIRITHNAFKAVSNSAIGASIYAYVALGEKSGMTDKPAENN